MGTQSLEGSRVGEVGGGGLEVEDEVFEGTQGSLAQETVFCEVNDLQGGEGGECRGVGRVLSVAH